MKLFLAVLVSGCAFFLNAADIPNETFVPIPANPDFVFARGMNPHSRESGEASPVNKAYCIAKYPVTNAEYQEFCKATGHRTPRYWKNGTFPTGKEKHPVLNISYDDALDYCEWFGKKNPGWRFRLPTEAEWENAAAGPKALEYPWGNDAGFRIVNGEMETNFNFNGVVAAYYLKTSPDMMVTYYHPKSSRQGEKEKLSAVISFGGRGGIRGWINHRDYTGFVYTDLFKKLSDEGGYTTPVDYYPMGVSAFGVFDMAGNSWDWTSSEITATNGAERGKRCNAIRGGSWYANAGSCKTNYRGEGRRPAGAYSTVGFRLVAEKK